MRRHECRLTKQCLSLMTGVNRLTLRRIEAGEANPTMDVMLKIACGLGLPLSELIAKGETGKPPAER